MKHLFVPYELALKLKEKGFDEKCIAFYNWKQTFNYMTIGLSNTDALLALAEGTITAPLYQQVIDWFWEKHKISVSADFQMWDDGCFTANWVHKPDILWLHLDDGEKEGSLWKRTKYDNRQDALNKAIEEALKLIK